MFKRTIVEDRCQSVNTKVWIWDKLWLRPACLIGPGGLDVPIDSCQRGEAVPYLTSVSLCDQSVGYYCRKQANLYRFVVAEGNALLQWRWRI